MIQAQGRQLGWVLTVPASLGKALPGNPETVPVGAWALHGPEERSVLLWARDGWSQGRPGALALVDMAPFWPSGSVYAAIGSSC